jgi:predicted DNA-binding protein
MQFPKKDIQIAIRVDVETKKALQVLADNDKRKLSDFIRIQLEKILEENVSTKK